MPINSPLFQEAGRQIQAAARRQFRSSDLGRLISEVERAVGSASRPTQQIQAAVRRYSTSRDPTRALQQMMGAEFGDVVRAVQRYSRPGASARIVNEFLDSLGPAGHLIKSLVDPSRKSALNKELGAAMQMIRAFGGETIPGSTWAEKGYATTADVTRGLQAAMEKLQSYGFAVVGSQGPPRRAPQPEEGRSTIDVGIGFKRVNEGEGWMEQTRTMRVPADHPMLTGDMVKCDGSSNVYEFGYDYEAAYLYVRFQAPHHADQMGGPGPLYRYSGVTPAEFLGLYAVRHMGGEDGPGGWVWDVLRQRGTVSGHKKDYELVGIMGGYVPRKATLKRTKPLYGKRTGKMLKKKGLEEWYEQRSVKTHEGRWARSVLSTARVMPVRGPH